MNGLDIQNQISKLKQDCEMQIAAETYRCSENVAFVRSQIAGTENEKEYYEKRVLVYESLKKDNMELSADILETIAELKERAKTLGARLTTLQQQLVKEEAKYHKAYKIAAMRAQRKYDTELKKIERSAQKINDEAVNE